MPLRTALQNAPSVAEKVGKTSWLSIWRAPISQTAAKRTSRPALRTAALPKRFSQRVSGFCTTPKPLFGTATISGRPTCSRRSRIGRSLLRHVAFEEHPVDALREALAVGPLLVAAGAVQLGLHLSRGG